MASPSSAAVAAVCSDQRLDPGFFGEALGDIDPVDVHRHVPEADLDEFLLPIQRAFTSSEGLTQLWHQFFEAVGFDPHLVATDRFQLRFQPPALAVAAAPWRPSTATVGTHRDTWATNLYSQVNWWGPVFPITAERTLGFYINHWDRPIPNDSAAFAIREGMIKLGKSRDDVQPQDLSPTPTLGLSTDQRLPVVIDVGDVIAFSGQHLHQGVTNVTDKTRISVEARTIRVSDHLVGRGAPNTDGSSPWSSPACSVGSATASDCQTSFRPRQ